MNFHGWRAWCTLFELAAGCLPYGGPENDFYQAKTRRAPPRPLKSVAPEAPPGFADLIDALLGPEPRLRPKADAILTSLGLRADVGSETLPDLQKLKQPPIGRDATMAFLESGMLEAAAHGRALRELCGVSGIGKSTVARWFCARARSKGGVIFGGGCYERESVPFKAFDHLFDRLVDRIARGDPAGRVAVVPAQRRALLRLFPGFRRVEEFQTAEEDSVEPTADSAAVRRDAFAALSDLIERYAGGRPIVIWLDDAQWADRDSAAAAAHLLSAAKTPLMILRCRRGVAPIAGDARGVGRHPRSTEDRDRPRACGLDGLSGAALRPIADPRAAHRSRASLGR